MFFGDFQNHLSNMNLSIVIPTYNGSHKILNALHALESQTFQDFETIVVIDGSTDDTVGKLKEYNTTLKSLTVVHQENKGRSVVRNTGVVCAKGEFVLFMDDDMRFEPNVVEEHVNFHQKNQNAILVGNQIEEYSKLTSDFQFFKAYLSRKWTSDIGATLTKMENPFITAAHCSLPKELFEKLGGFDEQLTDAEDYDLAVRAKEIGVDIYFNPTLIGWHDDFVTCQKYVLRLNQYKAANQKLAELYPERHKTKLYHLSFTAKLKRLFLRHQFLISAIDQGYFSFLPQKIRYKFFDYVITANS